MAREDKERREFDAEKKIKSIELEVERLVKEEEEARLYKLRSRRLSKLNQSVNMLDRSIIGISQNHSDES